MSRVLALDYGRARCGCAISDPSGTLATPLDVVERAPTRRGLLRIRSLVEERGVDQVVVGLPLTLAGREAEQAAETRAFADRLGRALDVPVEMHDERLTTRQATRTAAAGAAGAEDSLAAAHLLEDYLQRTSASAAADPTNGPDTVSRR